jgi:sRNA-binding protein
MNNPAQSRKAAAYAARGWMMTTWPRSIRAFKPLAIGVHEDVMTAADGLHSCRAIRDALHAHTSSPRYKAALSQSGAMRVALDGTEIEPVSFPG